MSCFKCTEYLHITSSWKSVPRSALSSQLKLTGSPCLSLHPLPSCCSTDCLKYTRIDLEWWKCGVCVPQDSASNTPELIWNDGSVESVCTLHTLSPLEVLPSSTNTQPASAADNTLTDPQAHGSDAQTVGTTLLMDRTSLPRVLLTQYANVGTLVEVPGLKVE
ncbi:UNVERIFIED_CONTAM: hypothetical protein Slati_3051600 [Sesamum latifolium]|uniref:Uncharacterized protein n=1 Tax=Sesamum latifolium TaxID=2727402 RepID=A0AAW2UV02_9LAMI